MTFIKFATGLFRFRWPLAWASTVAAQQDTIRYCNAEIANQRLRALTAESISARLEVRRAEAAAERDRAVATCAELEKALDTSRKTVAAAEQNMATSMKFVDHLAAHQNRN